MFYFKSSIIITHNDIDIDIFKFNVIVTSQWCQPNDKRLMQPVQTEFTWKLSFVILLVR